MQVRLLTGPASEMCQKLKWRRIHATSALPDQRTLRDAVTGSGLCALSGHHDESAECRIAGNSGHHQDCKQPFPRVAEDELAVWINRDACM
jgi:hypothetical protein